MRFRGDLALSPSQRARLSLIPYLIHSREGLHVNIFRREVALHPGPQPSPDRSISALFHENTKLHRLTALHAAGDTDYGVAELDAMARAYKRYRLRPKVELPPIPPLDNEPPLRATLTARRTRRSFDHHDMELAELSAILQLSYGITGNILIPGGGVQPLRAAPS